MSNVHAVTSTALWHAHKSLRLLLLQSIALFRLTKSTVLSRLQSQKLGSTVLNRMQVQLLPPAAASKPLNRGTSATMQYNWHWSGNRKEMAGYWRVCQNCGEKLSVTHDPLE